MIDDILVDDDRRTLRDLFRTGHLQATHLPLTDLSTGRLAALRIVTHGPVGGALADPGYLRTLVESSEHATTLDLTSLVVAFRHVQSLPVDLDVPAVIDVLPSSLMELAAADTVSERPLVLCIDSAQLLDHPAQLLRLVGAARDLGYELALRGVGASFHTLAAVSVIEPAYVVLDASIVHDPHSVLAMETLQTITGFAHGNGATVVAHDLDSPALLAHAHALGAVVGSGDAVTAEDDPGGDSPNPHGLELFYPPLPLPHHSPYDLAVKRHRPRRADKALLVSLSKQIEKIAASAGRSTIVLSAFQEARQIRRSTRARYVPLLSKVFMINMAAEGLERVPMPGVSVSNLDRSDPLRSEWVVIVLGPTTSVMLAATDRGVPSAEKDRQFDFVLTYDRDLVAHAARSMLTRLNRRA